MLEQEENLARRKAILAGKVEDMLNTVVRQIAFYDFEFRLHNERIKGELPADKICDLWLDVQTESLGPEALGLYIQPKITNLVCRQFSLNSFIMEPEFKIVKGNLSNNRI